MSSTSPKRNHMPMQGRVSSTSLTGSATLPRSRSSTLTRKKDLSTDEGSALNDMHKRVSVCVRACVCEGGRGRGREGGERGGKGGSLFIIIEGAVVNFPTQADMQYEDQKKKEAIAMKYWEQKKIEEQVLKFKATPSNQDTLMGSQESGRYLAAVLPFLITLCLFIGEVF